MDPTIVIVTYDQAHFNIDADVRRCWSFVGEPPIVYKNGSKRSVNVGGAYATDGTFTFYFMEHQVKENVLENIKILCKKHPKMLLLLDKATWNKNSLVMNYLDEHNIEYFFFPTGASDINPVEECWKQTRDNVTGNTSHNSEQQLIEDLSSYWRKQPFKHNVLNYLSP